MGKLLEAKQVTHQGITVVVAVGFVCHAKSQSRVNTII